MKEKKLSEIELNKIKFEAAFYADFELLTQYVKSPSDLEIIIPLTQKQKSYWFREILTINLLEILNWLMYSFYEDYDRDEACTRYYDRIGNLKSKDCINPSLLYKNATQCAEWVCSTFSIQNDKIKNYSEYRLLRHILYDDDGWLDEDEIEDALAEGFRQIDLDLINEAEKGNGISVLDLINKGANYKIDPVDYMDKSAILEILDSDLQYHKLNLIVYLNRRSNFDFHDALDMLSSLYQVGVGKYILEILLMNDTSIA